VPKHTNFGYKNGSDNTHKRLFWGIEKSGFGAKWTQSGHIEEKREFFGILKPFKTAATH
jgi:hypothetical protein